MAGQGTFVADADPDGGTDGFGEARVGCRLGRDGRSRNAGQHGKQPGSAGEWSTRQSLTRQSSKRWREVSM
ncbi:hypothetical protein GCM10010273_11570 [Streptomyces lavendulocolor]